MTATIHHLPVGKPELAALLSEVASFAAPYFLGLRFDPDVLASLGCPDLAVAMTALRTAPPRP